MSPQEKDKKNRQIGILVSAVAHIAVLLLFVFLVAWRAPNPPLPEFGIELNFGTSNRGTGDIQPQTRPAAAETTEEAKPDAPEEVVEEPEEVSEESPVEEVEEITEPVEETPAETPDQAGVPEEVTPVTETPTPAPVKEPEEKPAEKPEVVPKKETPKPPKVLYPGKEEGAAGTSGDENTPAAANQGDKTAATGDQGDPQGNVDARSLYGNAGGGGGTSLEMAGWMWDTKPDPEEDTSESGKIVFEVVIDDRGEVISTRPVNYTVSASLMKIYQAEVERLTFTQTSPGAAPPTTKGRITFIIKAK